LVEVCSWIAFLLLLGIAAVLVGLLSGRISQDDATRILLVDRRPIGYILAVLLIAIALYFGTLIVRAHRQRRLITHRGTHGAIRISPQAVRDFIVRALDEELGLPDCRVRLRPSLGKEGALVVLVRAPLPLGQNVIEVGEHVQELLKARVEERIGIAVERVEVFTSGMRSSARGAPPKKGSYITHFSEGEYEEDLRD